MYFFNDIIIVFFNDIIINILVVLYKKIEK
jgi:hypothetical protein